jgi:hypothetical protein
MRADGAGALALCPYQIPSEAIVSTPTVGFFLAANEIANANTTTWLRAFAEGKR